MWPIPGNTDLVTEDLFLETSWRLDRRDGNRDERYWEIQGGGEQSLESDKWMTLHKARTGQWFGATLATRNSDKNERNDILFPTEGLAKHDYKKAFVNMRSLLMEGESGWCQLLFVQWRKPHCLFPLGTPTWPQCFGKAAR